MGDGHSCATDGTQLTRFQNLVLINFAEYLPNIFIRKVTSMLPRKSRQESLEEFIAIDEIEDSANEIDLASELNTVNEQINNLEKNGFLDLNERINILNKLSNLSHITASTAKMVHVIDTKHFSIKYQEQTH